MPSDRPRVYWDSCVFLSYIEGVEARLPVLDALLDDSSRAQGFQIVTSTVSISEVAFALHEKNAHRLDADIEKRIDELWGDRLTIMLVDFHELIARDARALIRLGLPNEWTLKPIDAIHLATARRLRVAEFHTYDKKLHRYAGHLGIAIQDPVTKQPRLPM